MHETKLLVPLGFITCGVVFGIRNFTKYFPIVFDEVLEKANVSWKFSAIPPLQTFPVLADCRITLYRLSHDTVLHHDRPLGAGGTSIFNAVDFAKLAATRKVACMKTWRARNLRSMLKVSQGTSTFFSQ